MLSSGQGARTRLALALVVPVAIAANAGALASPAQAETVFTPLTVPTISGTAVEGEALQMKPGTWSTPPASSVVQWQRCNRSGNDCTSIEGAKSQTYRLTAADVGSTIRVAESAKNASGAVTPTLSEPTAVIQAHAAGGSGEKSGQGGGGNSPPGSCCGTPTHKSSATIQSLLARQLAPSGKAGRIAVLLRHRGLNMSFTLPKAGTLVVRWYFLPTGAKLSSKGRAKPVLVAAGKVTLTAAKSARIKIKLTARGRQLLRHATRIHLEAKGTFSPKGGAGVSATRAFTLKR
jgi:hypothetical protein